MDGLGAHRDATASGGGAGAPEGHARLDAGGDEDGVLHTLVRVGRRFAKRLHAVSAGLSRMLDREL